MSKVLLAGEETVKSSVFGWGWVAKRSALWVLILAGGITTACWIYAAASPDAGSETSNDLNQMSAPPATAGNRQI